MPIFVYKIAEKNVAIVAENSTVARDGLKNRYGNDVGTFLCTVDDIIQVTGNVVMDAESKIVE